MPLGILGVSTKVEELDNGGGDGDSDDSDGDADGDGDGLCGYGW